MKIGIDYLKDHFAIVLLVIGMLFSVWGLSLTLAQEHNDSEACDVTELATHWAEHAVNLSGFAQTADEDLDVALRELYVTGIAYQALAMECGFGDVMEAEREHDMAHGLEVSDADHDDVEADHDSDPMDIAMSIGDPENGQVLFNTLQPEVAFACATCHYVDSMERLVGPGLQGIGNPAHDPNAHSMTMDDAESDEHMDDAESDEQMDDEDAGEQMDDAESDEHMDDEDAGEHMDDEDADEQMDDEDADEQMDSMDMGSMDEVIDYIHTSILDPSASVVDGFPDNLMPSTYKDVFTEEEINDLIAYLLTLQ